MIIRYLDPWGKGLLTLRLLQGFCRSFGVWGEYRASGSVGRQTWAVSD